MPGQESGHTIQGLGGLTWKWYVQSLVEDFGGWSALADQLMIRSRDAVDIAGDIASVEKGLRRLSKKEHEAGGQYGRWLLRFIGLPGQVHDWLRWCGQYHSRFADLPISLRMQQLSLWERPPVSESASAAWLHLGFASVYQRIQDLPACERRLSLVGKHAEASAKIESCLLSARLKTDSGDRSTARALFDEAQDQLRAPTISETDRLCYRARLIGQRAYHLTKPAKGEPPDFEQAKAMFESIESSQTVPFASYRKNAGLAYCMWQLGDAPEGIRLARLAAENAADAGLVRFRVMAFNMLSKMLPNPEAQTIRHRATVLAQQLEDEDLLARIARAEARRHGSSKPKPHPK